MVNWQKGMVEESCLAHDSLEVGIETEVVVRERWRELGEDKQGMASVTCFLQLGPTSL